MVVIYVYFNEFRVICKILKCSCTQCFSVKETCGKITLKHLYEIAKIKSQDPPLEWRPLQEICTMLIATARTCGIEVVRDLDAKVKPFV